MIVETPGIGQGDAGIVPFVDRSLYVMTPEFGAASQLEKIDMLDYADVVAINKFERRGAEDARRDVARQLVRNRDAFGQSWEDMPVFGTSAATFNDDGVTALYHHLRDLLAAARRPAPADRARAASRAPIARPRATSRPSSRRRRCAISPTSPTPYAATTPSPTSRRRRRASGQHLRTAASGAGRGRRRPGRAAQVVEAAEQALPASRGRAARRLARGRRGLLR